MLPPKTSREGGGWGKGEGRHRAQGQAHDTYREAPTLEQTDKTTTRTHTSITARPTVPSMLTSLMHFCHQFQTIWYQDLAECFFFFFFGIAQLAHMTQDSSCPGLKDELQKRECSRSFFKEDPFSHPSRGIPFLHSHVSLLSIRSLKTHCG